MLELQFTLFLCEVDEPSYPDDQIPFYVIICKHYDFIENRDGWSACYFLVPALHLDVQHVLY